MELKETIPKFKEFLDQKGMLGAFLNGVLCEHPELASEPDPIESFCLKERNVDQWINYGVCWSNSYPSDHWSDLHNKWFDLVNSEDFVF